MIQHTRYCDRCGNEIINDECSTIEQALHTLASIAKKIIDGKGFPKYYIGIKEGPELDLCEKCLDELRDFMKAGREEKAEK